MALAATADGSLGDPRRVRRRDQRAAQRSRRTRRIAGRVRVPRRACRLPPSRRRQRRRRRSPTGPTAFVGRRSRRTPRPSASPTRSAIRRSRRRARSSPRSSPITLITVGVVRRLARPTGCPTRETREQLTVDHSLGTELIAAGKSRAEAEADPTSHTITRWLGADSVDHAPEVALAATSTAPGWVLVCSDGLWNYASALGDDASTLLTDVSAPAGTDPFRWPSALVAWANAAGRPRQHHRRPGPLRPDRYASRPPRRGGRHVAEFKAEVFQNEYLADGATDVHAVVSVTLHRRRHGRAVRARRGRRDPHRRHVGLDGHAAVEDRRGPAGRQGGDRARSSTARGSPSSAVTASPRWCTPRTPAWRR